MELGDRAGPACGGELAPVAGAKIKCAHCQAVLLLGSHPAAPDGHHAGACRRSAAQELARNDQLLNLARPLVDAERTHLTVELLDDVAAHDAEPAEELYR